MVAVILFMAMLVILFIAMLVTMIMEAKTKREVELNKAGLTPPGWVPRNK